MRNLVAVLGTLTLAVVHTAHADADVIAVQPRAQPAAPASVDEDDGPKSQGVAVALTIGGSLVGPALVTSAIVDGADAGSPLHAHFDALMIAGGASIVLGPSLGNWYAGKGWSKGLGWRVAGMAVGAVGVSMISSGFAIFGDGNSGEVIGGGVLGLVAIGMVAGGTASELVSAPRAAADYNRRHRGATMSLAPIVSHANGAQQTGLAVVGSF
jgi:hypothetical protein